MFKIYGKVGCSSCLQAKALLESKGLEYSYLTLGKDYQPSEFLKIKEGHKSFPLIVEGDKYVGSFESLKAYLKD